MSDKKYASSNVEEAQHLYASLLLEQFLYYGIYVFLIYGVQN